MCFFHLLPIFRENVLHLILTYAKMMKAGLDWFSIDNREEGGRSSDIQGDFAAHLLVNNRVSMFDIIYQCYYRVFIVDPITLSTLSLLGECFLR